MTLNQLENFVAVVEAGSFSKAAQARYLSPQALIQQIKKLEQELGFSLLIRHSHGVELSAAGREYYGCAQRFLADHRSSVERALRISQNTSILKIGMPNSITPSYLFSVCREFSARYPLVKLHYVSCPWEESQKAMLNGLVDIAAQIDIERDTPFYREKLFPIHHFCLVEPNHPLAAEKSLTPEDLALSRIGFWGPLEIYNRLSLYAAKHHFRLQMERLPQTVSASLNFCEEGSILITCAPLVDILKDSLVVIPLAFDLDIHYYLACSDNTGMMAQEFLTIARKIAGSLGHPWRKTLKSIYKKSSI